MLVRDEMRQNRTARGPIERAHNSKEHQYRINRRHGLRLVCSQRQKSHKTNSKSHVASDQNLFAVEDIGDMARHQEEDNAGKELRETDEAEVERALGNFVDLP